jgi:hypothetical protein
MYHPAMVMTLHPPCHSCHFVNIFFSKTSEPNGKKLLRNALLVELMRICDFGAMCLINLKKSNLGCVAFDVAIK